MCSVMWSNDEDSRIVYLELIFTDGAGRHHNVGANNGAFGELVMLVGGGGTI